MNLFEVAPDSVIARLRPPSRRGRGLPWQVLANLAWSFWIFAPPLLYDGSLQHWLVPTLTSFVVFLLLYFRTYAAPRRQLLAHALAIGALGFLLTPVNWGGQSYVIYACAFLAFQGPRPRDAVAVMLGLIALYAWECAWLGWPPFYIAAPAVTSFAIGLMNLMYRRSAEANAQLHMSQEELRRLAATAERERIGRDLHDLLGHTLSLVALKSELAARLVARDAEAAGREMREVERVAREALAEVRAAVSGLRAPELMAELAAARLLLETGGVHVDNRIATTNLPAEQDAALAMVLREAATNVLRHAAATRVDIHLEEEGTQVRLCVRDDGRGGVAREGNGLAGMRERLAALGGSLRLDGSTGRGMRLCAELPLPHAQRSLAEGIPAAPPPDFGVTGAALTGAGQ